MKTPSLVFQNTTFDIIDRSGQPWLRGNQIAQALGYSDERSITKIYSRNAEEFSNAMTSVVKLTPQGEQARDIRIFSMRGCYALAMFAKTAIGKEFRKWVLDILDHEAPAQPITITPDQQNTLQQMVAFKAGNEGGLRAYCWSRFNNHFHLGSYKQLPTASFDEAVQYLASLPMKKELPAPAAVAPLFGQRILARLEADGRYSCEIVPADAYVLTLASFEELLKRAGKVIVPIEAVRALQGVAL